MAETMNLTQAFDQWQQTRGYSDQTRKRRATTLRTFTAWIAPLDLADADGTLVDEWLNTYLAPATRHAYLCDLRAFYRWALKRRALTVDPTIDVDPVKVPTTLARPVDRALIAQLVASAGDFNLRLSVALMAYAGLRRAEVANLCGEDVALGVAQPHLIVRNGKGSKDRITVVLPQLAPLLAARRRRNGRLVDWTPDTIGRNVAAHLRAHGIEATGHKLRSTFASEVYAKTLDLQLLMALMGHSKPETSLRYVGAARVLERPLDGMYSNVA